MSGFKDRFPRWITLVIGLIQLLLTAAVVGLEVGSVYIDLAHGTIWVGFWAGLVFIITFMTMLFISKISINREFELISFLFVF